MNYRYNRGPSGLGWTGAFTRPDSSTVSRGVRCVMPAGSASRGEEGNIICGMAPQEEQHLTVQGCRPVSLYGGMNCSTHPDGNAGTFWCCPPGRPGTAQSPETTVTQPPLANRDIQELQRYINAQSGCDVGSHGVDGDYGPDTAAGLQCVIAQQGHATVVGRFPFITTLISTPTGQRRPDDFTFSPGSEQKTPEELVLSQQKGQRTSGSVSRSGSTQADLNIEERRQQASMLFGIPWWGWGLIAVGGVAFLGIVGAVVLGDDEDDRRRKPRDRRELEEMRGGYFDEDDFDKDDYFDDDDYYSDYGRGRRRY